MLSTSAFAIVGEHLLAVAFEPVALAAQDEHHGVVHQAVDERSHGHGFLLVILLTTRMDTARLRVEE